MGTVKILLLSGLSAAVGKHLAAAVGLKLQLIEGMSYKGKLIRTRMFDLTGVLKSVSVGS